MKKIVHICMTSPYLQGWGYDENIMPIYHKKMGYDVYVFSCFDDKGELEPCFDDNGVHVKRFSDGLRIKDYLNPMFRSSLFRDLCKLKPDVIYVHNAQFPGFFDVVRFMKRNKSVRLFVDNHDDYYNAPIDGIVSFVQKKCIFRIQFLLANKYVKVFWGVTPWRCRYLHEVFGVPKNKIHLLVMGADDRKIHFDSQSEIKKIIREKYEIADDDFLIVTGGKIDKEKNFHHLMDSIKELKNDKVKLIIFGKITDDFKETFEAKMETDKIKYIGWLDPGDVYDYYLSADLAVFPGTHSILWEQACACGVPIVVKDWDDMHHVDLGGNAFFLKHSSKEEITRTLKEIIENEELYIRAKNVALQKGIRHFSYSRISRKAIAGENGKQ